MLPLLNHGIGFVRLAEKARSGLHLVDGIGNLMPNDGRQVVDPKIPAVLLNRGMKRNHGVPAIIFSAREAHISNHTDKATARDQRPEAVVSHLIELGEEIVVVLNVAHLAF